MAAANVHTEEYEVTTQPTESTTPPIRLHFCVTARNVNGDNPVEEMYLSRYTSGDTRKGREHVVDATAQIKLVDDGGNLTDYTDAKAQIHIGSTVSYLSTKQSSNEIISQFVWS
jgi:hypothetical protein